MKLLLHTCCGPCFLGVWEELGQHSEIETDLFYFNPNIQPESEYIKRLESLEKASASKSVKLHVGDYLPQRHHEVVSGHKGEFPRRCLSCYRLRLTETAERAKVGGYDAFSTTLLVSPYQQHEDLKKIAEEIANECGLEFYYSDWRPYFRAGQAEAKTEALYLQRYCGCELSRKEAEESRNKSRRK